MPLPVIVGPSAFFSDGEPDGTPPLPANPSPCRCYPLACYGLATIGQYDFQCCGTVLQFAKILNATYIDGGLAQTLAKNFFGLDWSFGYDAQAGAETPATLIGWNAKGTVAVFVTGTTTPQQLALQVLYAAYGLLDYGLYSTFDFWQRNAQIVLDRIAGAVPLPVREIYLCGHSYGAAIAQLVAAMLRPGNPDLSINILTFGMPCVGDDRINRILGKAYYVHYRNLGDPVPGLPPRGSDLVTMASLILPINLPKYDVLAPANGGTILEDGGIEYEDDGETVPYGVLQAIIELIQAGMDVAPFDAHLLPTYISRLNQICPVPPGPPALGVAIALNNAFIQDAYGNARAYDFFWPNIDYDPVMQAWFGTYLGNTAVILPSFDENGCLGPFTAFLTITTDIGTVQFSVEGAQTLSSGSDTFVPVNILTPGYSKYPGSTNPSIPIYVGFPFSPCPP